MKIYLLWLSSERFVYNYQVDVQRVQGLWMTLLVICMLQTLYHFEDN